jgi:UDP-glucose 4-epimerase
MKVAVTGSAGFIGKYVCRELASRDISVIGVDSHNGMDVRSTQAYSTIKHNADGVIHLAGILGTAELFERAQEAVDVNINGTLNVLSACELNQIPFVGITMPQVWDNVYQSTKQAAYSLAHAWQRHRGVPVRHVRAFNVYGGGQKVFGVQKLIPTAAYHAWRGEDIEVWGDGLQKIDLIWAGDVARILVDALEMPVAPDIIDAGTGLAWTVNDAVHYICQIAESDSHIKYLPMRPGEHGDGVVSEREGQDALDWKPIFEDAAFEKTVQSYDLDYEGS